jgi:hypothetical protein
LADEPQKIIDSLLRDQITTLERNLNQRLDGTERNLNRRLDQQDTALAEIRTQTTKTNGRVTMLEKARERAQGVRSAYSWVPVALGSILTAGLTILIMALGGGIH